MHHPKADVSRMYIPRKEGGRGMINLEMTYKTATIGLNSYLESSEDRMLHAVLQHEKKKKPHSVVKESRKFKFQLNMAQGEIDTNMKPTKAAKDIKKKAKNASLEDMKNGWREKPLHGKYPLRTGHADVDKATTHQWLSSSSLKGETEGFILAAQDQSISTRVYQTRICKNGADPNYRLCTEKEETVHHIISTCPTIVNTEYLQRHDRVAKFIHWTLCKNFNHPHTEKWCEHTPQPVIESTEVTILWDFTIHTDRRIDANRPDIIIKDHREKTCIMLNVAVPPDKDISLKEFQKLSKYKDLEIEVTKMWKLKTKTIPVVIGALGMIKKDTQNFIDQIPGKPSLQEMQKIVLTSTAHILRKVLSM